MYTPVDRPLLTPRLELTPVTAHDLPALWNIHSHPAAFADDSIGPLSTVDQMRHVLNRWLLKWHTDGIGYHCVRLRPETGAHGRVVGVCGTKFLTLNGRKVLNCYYRMLPEAWGQGYATEAMRALLGLADRMLPGTEIIVHTASANLRSRRLASRLGFLPTDERDEEDPTDHVILRRIAGAGRYAPSPSGDLHLGNLRTAVLAWMAARREGRPFVMRVEDLDRVRPGAATRQLEDLATLGLDYDDEVLFQSSRSDAYARALSTLTEQGLAYECYCTRREILSAPSAPHSPPGAYPGTCRNLNEAARERGRARMRELSREPALRLRSSVRSWTVHDRHAGIVSASVDDLVLRRGDGVVAYNLAVVVDDAYQGVGQIVRGDDLLTSAPRQAYLAHLLGLPTPDYVHVPLAVNTSGARLAKRDGAVTLRERLQRGESVPQVIEQISASLGYPGIDDVHDLVLAFDPDAMPSTPWVVTGD
ncbi:tRNA glutamyl-Q(34) synthetase GluQRS [Devriesea agamarum]|uniref:tRNA glutamyl-Q(34) synthetase GluQRS n=1 Tax=Devriesea agamarum TaxID=472569 RepID=UPI0038B2C6E3